MKEFWLMTEIITKLKLTQEQISLLDEILQRRCHVVQGYKLMDNRVALEAREEGAIEQIKKYYTTKLFMDFGVKIMQANYFEQKVELMREQEKTIYKVWVLA